MTSREIIFWTADRDAERLQADTVEEAIQEWYDDYYEADQHLDEPLTVYGYARMSVTPPLYLAERILEMAHECLGEEFGNPDEVISIPKSTKRQKEAVERFIQEFLLDFTPWVCDQVEQRTVIPREILGVDGSGDD